MCTSAPPPKQCVVPEFLQDERTSHRCVCLDGHTGRLAVLRHIVSTDVTVVCLADRAQDPHECSMPPSASSLRSPRQARRATGAPPCGTDACGCCRRDCVSGRLRKEPNYQASYGWSLSIVTHVSQVGQFLYPFLIWSHICPHDLPPTVVPRSDPDISV